MSPRDPELDSTERGGWRRPVIALLPAFHREQGGLAASLAEAAEELLESFETSKAQLAEHLGDFAQGAATGRPSIAGTARAAGEWLAARHGSMPRIVCGRIAEAPVAGSLELRPSTRPTAVIAWDRDVLPPERREGLSLAAELIPPGVLVQIVVLKLPAAGWPRAGERVPGEIVWDGSRPAGAGDTP